MLISCWSSKGGAGTTTVSVALAVLGAQRHGSSVLVDLAGEVPAMLGAEDLDGPGVADWLAAGPSVAPAGWARLGRSVGGGVTVVRRGTGSLAHRERAEVLAAMLAAGPEPVIVDCAVPAGDDAPAVLAAAATCSLLVTRACVLALQRGQHQPVRPSGVVLVHESGRSLRRRDVESAIGAPVVAEVPVDPAVARAVDAGRLAAALPRSLARSLRGLA